MLIRDMPNENRPRERLDKFGASALSEAELLAIILKTGTKKENVIDLSNKILDKYSLDKLANCSLTELKQERGIKKGGGEEEISRIVMPLVDIIFGEIDKLTSIYFQKNGKRVTKFMLSGGTARMPGLVEYFVEKFGREIQIGDPFKGIDYPPVLAPILREVGPAFATAVGLAMRELKND